VTKAYPFGTCFVCGRPIHEEDRPELAREVTWWVPRDPNADEATWARIREQTEQPTGRIAHRECAEPIPDRPTGLVAHGECVDPEEES
jgi:hypothetical protein